MILRMNSVDRMKIQAFAEESYPNECCGFLIGTTGAAQKVVEKVRFANNSRTRKHNRYLIDPAEFQSVERALRESSCEIVGFFHSHPDVAAEPSPYDLEYAWPWYSYLIVSVRHGKAVEANSWQLKDDRSAFEPEAIALQEGKKQCQ